MQRAAFDINLSEEDWELVLKAIHNDISKCNGILKREMNHPTASIRGDETLDATKNKIERLKNIVDQIRERFF